MKKRRKDFTFGQNINIHDADCFNGGKQYENMKINLNFYGKKI